MLIAFGEMRPCRFVLIVLLRAACRRHEDCFDQRQDRSMVTHGGGNVAWFGKRRDRDKWNPDAVLIKVSACRRKRSGRIKSELRAQISRVVRGGIGRAEQIE